MRPTTLPLAVFFVLAAHSPGMCDDGQLLVKLEWFGGVLIVVVTYLLVFIGVSKTLKGLSASGSSWSITNALSESQPVELSDNQGNKSLAYPPSSSRLIAFLGLIVIMALFLGFGGVMLWRYGSTGKLDDIGNVVNFLWVGASLFAPYMVNQASSALKGVLGK